MEYIDIKVSLDYKLQISSICSIGTLSINWDIFQKLLHLNSNRPFLRMESTEHQICDMVVDIDAHHMVTIWDTFSNISIQHHIWQRQKWHHRNMLVAPKQYRADRDQDDTRKDSDDHMNEYDHRDHHTSELYHHNQAGVRSRVHRNSSIDMEPYFIK